MNNWYYIEPLANGYLGVSKAGEFWSASRKELIKILLWTSYKNTKKIKKVTT